MERKDKLHIVNQSSTIRKGRSNENVPRRNQKITDMKTLLSLFVEENRDRDDIVGDLCYDLYHDDLFHAKKTETDQMAFINRLPSLHGDHLIDAVKEFKALFKEYSREL
jgi:hypothetical protein